MIGAYIFAVASFIFSIIFSWFRSVATTVYSLCLKISASVCFIISAIFAINAVGATNISLLIIVGLIFGLVGDVLLDLKIMYPKQDNEYFVSGTFSFAIGHFFYFLALIMYNCEVIPNNLIWNIIAGLVIATLLTTIIMLSSKKLGLNFGNMLWIVIIYSFILTFMMSFSIAIAIFVPQFWIFAVGMILFFLSDLVLSMQYFGGKDQKIFIYINHILYYLAQIMIAISILYLF